MTNMQCMLRTAVVLGALMIAILFWITAVNYSRTCPSYTSGGGTRPGTLGPDPSYGRTLEHSILRLGACG